jgi:hypothetical protein
VTTSTFQAIGASESEATELLAYAGDGLDTRLAPAYTYPLPDEPFVAAWRDYEREARRIGAAECLQQRFVQLHFPIAAGMSRRDDYRAAVRRGIQPPERKPGVRFAEPGGLRLMLHPTPAGRLPVIVASAREDFETLVRAFTKRNEPEDIPPSMGACIVAGYNNWDRVASLRSAWTAVHGPAADWAGEFQRIVPYKELYQDRFVVLSSGAYSATPARTIGFDDASWIRTSLVIRLEHECAHYFTRRVFGSMRNSLLDELIADYVGIVTAAGRFRGDWFLRFMGLEAYPVYRDGGRLQNYRGTPPLSDGAFTVLHSAVVRAAETLERFDARLQQDEAPRSMAQRAMVITALVRLGLERLATAGADLLLLSELEELMAAATARSTTPGDRCNGQAAGEPHIVSRHVSLSIEQS